MRFVTFPVDPQMQRNPPSVILEMVTHLWDATTVRSDGSRCDEYTGIGLAGGGSAFVFLPLDEVRAVIEAAENDDDILQQIMGRRS